MKIIDRYFSFLDKGLTLAKWRWRIACQNRSSRFSCILIKERKTFKKEKKRTCTYMLGICTSVSENLQERQNQILLDYSGWWPNQSCQIFFKSVDSDVFGKRSNFAILINSFTLHFIFHSSAHRSLRCYFFIHDVVSVPEKANRNSFLSALWCTLNLPHSLTLLISPHFITCFVNHT